MCQLLMHNLLAAEEVLEHAWEAVRIAPDTSIYRVWLANSFARVGNDKRCHEQLMKALELDPKSSIVHRHLSDYHQRHDELQKALEHANRAVEIHPTDPHAYSARAVIWRDLGQVDKAMEDLNRALELQPNAGDIRVNVVICCIRCNDMRMQNVTLVRPLLIILLCFTSMGVAR